MRSLEKQMKKERNKLIYSIMGILLGIVVIFFFEKDIVEYVNAANKVKIKAYFDEEKSPHYSERVEEEVYRITWSYEYDGSVHSFKTEENQLPTSGSSRTVLGYINKNGKLQIISHDGWFHIVGRALLGPLLIFYSIILLIGSSKKYKRARKTWKKEKALIEERIATQDELE